MSMNSFLLLDFFAKKSVIEDCFLFRLLVDASFSDEEAVIAELVGTPISHKAAIIAVL